MSVALPAPAGAGLTLTGVGLAETLLADRDRWPVSSFMTAAAQRHSRRTANMTATALNTVGPVREGRFCAPAAGRRGGSLSTEPRGTAIVGARSGAGSGAAGRGGLRGRVRSASSAFHLLWSASPNRLRT